MTDLSGQSMTDLSRQKKTAREAARARLSRLSQADFERIGGMIALRVFAHPFYRAAGSVFCFVGAGREIDTRPILTRALLDGKTLLTPRCEEKGVITARKIDSLSSLSPGRFGIPEPGADAPIWDRAAIDLILVPCLAAAPSGARLGRGGGYYDRYLADHHGNALILCPEALLFDQLPEDAWDKRAMGVITEKRTLNQSPRT